MTIGFDASRAFLPKRTGTENYSFYLLQALAKLDQKNTYSIYISPRADKGEVETFKAGLPENFNVKLIDWKRLWTQVGLALEILAHPVDVLFVPAHTLPVLHLPNQKMVVTIHDLGAEYLPQYHQFPQKYYLNASTVYATKAATKIISVSEFTKNDLVKKLGCKKEKIEVIYEGVSFQNEKLSKEEKSEVLKKYSVTGDFILSVGTVQPRKNYERLIEAFSKYHDTVKKPLQLIIVGKKGWLYDKIISAPERYNVKQNVLFLEYVTDEDLQALYQAAKLFVMPSLFEGFGLPVLEAMHYNLPVVSSNSSSLPEVVGNAGILVDPYSVEGIAQAIEKGLEDTKLRARLVEKGQEQVEKFSWEKAAKATLSVFESI